MKYFITLALLCCISTGSFAKDELASKHELFITQLIKQQTKQQISVQKSVSSILARYPEQVETVLKVSLALHPKEFKQIMIGALDAEPVLACNIIEHFLQNNIASTTELVKILVEAEPAYAQEILNSAILHDPENMEDIVRVAIKTEPLTSRQMLSNTMTSFPERMIDILTGFVKAIPDNVSQWVSYTFLLFPENGEEIIKTAIHSTNEKHDQDIINAAIHAGVDKNLALSVAADSGVSLTSIKKSN